MKKILLGLATVALLSMSCETENVSTQSVSAIAGNYVLTTLQANAAVDLDGNGTSSTDLMTEAVCVQQMTVNFDTNGGFTAVVADVSYDVNNQLTCTTTTETGTYTFVNGLLTMTANVNGGTVTESKMVVLNPTTFSFTIDSTDIMRFFPDIAMTAANGITNLNVVYTKI